MIALLQLLNVMEHFDSKDREKSGVKADRDENAARNIFLKHLKVPEGTVQIDVTQEGIPLL